MIVNADSIRIPLADGSVHMAVTSPPYWGLRSYLPADHPLKPYELGAEPLHDCLGWATGAPCGECYVCHMVAVFREVRRVLRDDGVVFLNLGDSYANSGAGGGQSDFSTSGLKRDGRSEESRVKTLTQNAKELQRVRPATGRILVNLKPKDLVGIPWRVALALQADGWWLRSDIIWAKPNPMPESVTDRPTKAHEYLFLMAKSQRYFYDTEAVKEEGSGRIPGNRVPQKIDASRNDGGSTGIFEAQQKPQVDRNRRTVWTIATRPFSGAHFAVFPPDLVAPCVLAGTSQRGVCPECGAPWERVVERALINTEGWGKATKDHHLTPDAITRNGKGGAGDSVTETTGWRPTCSHDADPIPAKVLDCFAGSGTVGQVCRETGRAFVGLDLNPGYLRDLALPRAEMKQAASVLAALPLFGLGA